MGSGFIFTQPIEELELFWASLLGLYNEVGTVLALVVGEESDIGLF